MSAAVVAQNLLISCKPPFWQAMDAHSDRLQESPFAMDAHGRQESPREWKTTQCSICAWRRKNIYDPEADPDGVSDAPEDCCDSACQRILRGLHTFPGALWKAIISTNTLSRCSLPQQRIGSAEQWVRIPLRLEHHRVLGPSDCNFLYNGQWHGQSAGVLGFHNTRLSSLVGPSVGGMGNGILVDRRLRYGECSHNSKIGVNVYSDGGVETFSGHIGWVSLEVHCCNTTRLNSGRPNRYCIRGSTGDLCMKAVLVALWVPLQECPSVVFLA